MGIFIGSVEITDGNLHIGSTPVQEVYVGSQKVWPPAPPSTDIHFATLWAMASVSITPYGIPGAFAVRAGERIDLTSGTTTYIELSGFVESIEVYFPIATYTRDAHISFREDTVPPPVGGVVSVTLHDFGPLVSLDSLVMSCKDLESIVIEDTRDTIESLYKTFYGTPKLETYPTMDYSGVLYASSAFEKSKGGGDLVFDFSSLTTANYMFNCEDADVPSAINSISITCPNLIESEKMFGMVQNLTKIHIITSNALLECPMMFRYCRKLECISGIIDTTGASNSNYMFDVCDVLAQPTVAEQDAIEDGDHWEGPSCP